ncbi:glutathione S-transferase family protein [Aestuariirhabdus sp. Z084]|uniref:glutathione S-transferase family protein n=1 Tax=Aestuariirhabdus haliotis TaxID=2918751 RepID=UPI00201B3868|nr:glutathione S-transferase family protein [Aestuariirhabdus haliotis]MCL6414032.1 glutathione S-transferase family protein [Aestuariirhabdus haliotis]MCL6417965.1 glutathione S-transferase family protein [Aestuariirhabdus haliotis]
MPVNASDIILHNYPQSPVAEKIRVALGIKGLAWYDVEIPRLPPKPLLTPLTGGYRRTPVMQIGADIYCDSQCIIRELERRYPSPTFMPSEDAGLMWCLSRWTDGELFSLAVKIVLGSAGDSLPEDFAKDRGLLYLGENWAARLKQANDQLPHLVAQLRAPLSWLNQTLSDGRVFLLGPAPAAIDAQFYHVVWFIRGRWDGGPSLFSEFPHLERWEHNVSAIGHGTSAALAAEEALDIALNSEPSIVSQSVKNDPQGLAVGTKVSVGPDLESGEQSVEGIVRNLDTDSISIERTTEEVGTVCVHFPRVGYRVEV